MNKNDLKKISPNELLGILGQLGKATTAAAALADGATQQEVARLLMNLDDVRNAIRRAMES